MLVLLNYNIYIYIRNICSYVIYLNIYQDNFVERLEHLSDIAVKLESFAGSAKETNPLFKDYHGLLHIQKLPALNILAPHTPESRDLAFKLRRKKFIIEVNTLINL